MESLHWGLPRVPMELAAAGSFSPEVGEGWDDGPRVLKVAALRLHPDPLPTPTILRHIEKLYDPHLAPRLVHIRAAHGRHPPANALAKLPRSH